MPSTEQLELSQRLLNSEEQVLEEILRILGPPISIVLSRRYHELLSEADIEDALSMGLYRLWNSRQTYDPDRASLKLWFFRIVENAIRDVLRLGWHRARSMEIGWESTALAQAARAPRNGESNLPAKAPSAKQLQLREIVESLPETQRTIILADSASPEGTASSQRLAEELSVSASSVRVYRKRAMDRIRSEMRQRGHEVP